MHLAGRPGLGRIGLRLNQTGARRVHSDPNADPKPSHPIAMTWGDVVIPSREDILRNPHARNIVPQADKAKSYKPDLRYLNESTVNSLASRLARKLEIPQEAPEQIFPSDTSSISTTTEQPVVDHTIAQRRALRLAREAEKLESREKFKHVSPSSISTAMGRPVRDNIAQRRAAPLARDEAVKSEKSEKTPEQISPSSVPITTERPVDHTIAQRRAERLAREETARLQSQRASPQDVSPGTESRYKQPLWQLTGMEEQNHRDETIPIHSRLIRTGQQSRRGGVASSNRARAGRNAGRGSFQRSRGVAARPRAIQTVPGPLRSYRAGAGEEMNGNEDITLEALEEGGDQKEPAEFKGPDATLTDLDVVLGSTVSNSDTLSSRQREEYVIDHPRWVQEGSGGDYARFAPYSSRDFLISQRKMSPVMHIQLVLSQRGDVPIIARHRALDIVESSVGEAGTISVRRA